MENNNTSINILISNAQKQIGEMINSSPLPPVIWVFLFKDILQQLEILTNQQLQQELQQQTLKEQEQQEEGNKIN